MSFYNEVLREPTKYNYKIFESIILYFYVALYNIKHLNNFYSILINILINNLPNDINTLSIIKQKLYCDEFDHNNTFI